jgi:hypothetical protein
MKSMLLDLRPWLINLWQCQMVDKNEMSNFWQRQSFFNKMIVVLFQIYARAWPLKTMNRNCKEAQLVVLWSFHNEPSRLINGFVGHSELTESNGFVVHHELIELINSLVGHIELTELISLVLDGHMKDFQQGALCSISTTVACSIIPLLASKGLSS